MPPPGILSSTPPQCCHSPGKMKNSDPSKTLGIRVMSQDFQKQLKGYGLTTANILYRRPDHHWLLQTYVWQNYDLCPDFPELQVFFGIWAEIARRCRAFGHEPASAVSALLFPKRRLIHLSCGNRWESAIWELVSRRDWKSVG
jgi:uncharacterized protein Usg